MMPDTRQRILAPEIMDDFAMEGEQLQRALEKIAQINRRLGGNRITIKGVDMLMRAMPAGKEVHIVDIGCGNGDMLRALADYGRKKQWQLRLTGIDANAFTIRLADDLSVAYPEISYRCLDVTQGPLSAMTGDILLLTLTLHHFTDAEIRTLMEGFRRCAAVGIVVNDLHRSGMAYRLFQLLCYALRLEEMTRYDGLTSIMRGFKRSELIQLSQQLNIRRQSLRWRWAFRYQWVISNL
ncbi:methyltransferase domain-containing protein [Chitinophaga qingshengii]|uniref:Methyltransferase domain-containing protein n=1 Tax=Chitinophaga qingshengii TaxID=1569794 RepID=A0ABR7TP19_9BACT|nr:methyltransferase domain-containing protein [Chitinophaga qingshengii]MBC9932222.1 methyltransferase domain-containing protein [Chitinophaga qingshengii]